MEKTQANAKKNDCDNILIKGVTIFLLAITIVVVITFVIVIIPLFPANFQYIFLFCLVVALILAIGVVCFTRHISKKTINLIKKYPSRLNGKEHHAIIIAHKNEPKLGKFPWNDYLSGEDVLIEKFQNCLKESNYKIYEVYTKDQVIPIILDVNTTHLWIFGHGQSNKLKLMNEDLCYFEVRNAPNKVFIGQYHCNSILGKSLGYYNKPFIQDITRFPRIDPFIRFSVKRKLKELKMKNLL
jgi:hypothetical protein